MMSTARSTDQTNPEQSRHLGVDMGSKEGDRTVEVHVSTPNPLTILDLIIYCAEHKYPITARIAIDIEDGDDFDAKIDGCHGHGHDESETLILKTINLSPPQVSSGKDCFTCADTACSSKPLPQRECSGYVNDRNYPVAPISQREAEQKKACCGNCAKRLELSGCETYSETNDDGCCTNHKFL